MSGRNLFILDIADRTVTGLLCESGKRSLVALASSYAELSPDLDYREAVAEVATRCGAKPGRCCLLLPASVFYFRNLTLPFVDPKKIRDILHYELQDQFSFGDQPFAYDTAIVEMDGRQTQLLAAAVRESDLDPWRQILGELGLEPAFVGISMQTRPLELADSAGGMDDTFVYIDAGRYESTFFLVAGGILHTIRALPAMDGDEAQNLAAEMRRTILAAGPQEHNSSSLKLQVGGAADRHVLDLKHFQAMAASLAIGEVHADSRIITGEPALQALPKHLHARLSGVLTMPLNDRRLINVQRGEIADSEGGRNVKRIAPVLAALMLVFLVAAGYQIYDFKRIAKERDRLVGQAEQIYTETLGGQKPVRDPVQELRAEIDEIDQSVAAAIVQNPEIKAVTVLADISKRMPTTVEVSFERFSFDRKQVKIDGTTGTYNDVDRIKRSLENSLLYTGVSIDSAGSSGSGAGVKFALTLLL